MDLLSEARMDRLINTYYALRISMERTLFLDSVLGTALLLNRQVHTMIQIRLPRYFLECANQGSHAFFVVMKLEYFNMSNVRMPIKNIQN